MKRMWIMHTAEHFYPIEPSAKCKAEDHGALNDHVQKITCAYSGKVLWERETTQ